jgi:hypothetical protein
MAHIDTTQDHEPAAQSCCAPKQPETASHHAHGGSGASPLNTAAQATLHCLTGCVIGEVAGLMIGVTLGLSVWATMGLATALAFIVGFALTIFPLMKNTGLNFQAALKAIWLGELISIAVMEVVMNAVDYHMGGVQASTVASWQFWRGVLIAVPAGYVAALPVNFWLIGRELKRCH